MVHYDEFFKKSNQGFRILGFLLGSAYCHNIMDDYYHSESTSKVVDPKGQKSSLKSWFDFYTAKKLIVFGHWAALDGIIKDNVIGLDTGCVYGKKLTALILSDFASSPNSPKREIVSVQAKKQYLTIE